MVDREQGRNTRLQRAWAATGHFRLPLTGTVVCVQTSPHSGHILALLGAVACRAHDTGQALASLASWGAEPTTRVKHSRLWSRPALSPAGDGRETAGSSPCPPARRAPPRPRHSCDLRGPRGAARPRTARASCRAPAPGWATGTGAM